MGAAAARRPSTARAAAPIQHRVLRALRMPDLRHSVRGSAAAPVLVQQPVRRVPDLPRLRQHHRARSGAGGARSAEVDQPGRDRAVDQAALPLASRRVEARRQDQGRPPRRGVARPDAGRNRVRDGRRRRRLRRRARILPLARAQEIQGPRPRVPEPLSRLPDLPGLRRHAAAPRSARRACRRRDDRQGVGAHRARSREVLHGAAAHREGSGDRRQGAEGDPAPARLPARRRPRLPDARSPVVDAVGRRSAAHQPRDVARLGAGRHALRARRAVDRPAHARQPAADRDPSAAARSGQHRDRRRARRRHDRRGGSPGRHGPRRRRARRPRGLFRHARRA